MHEINGTGRSHNPTRRVTALALQLARRKHMGKRIFGAENQPERKRDDYTLDKDTVTQRCVRYTTSTARHVVPNRTRAISLRLSLPFCMISINKPAKCKAKTIVAYNEYRYTVGGIMKACLQPCYCSQTEEQKGSIDDRVKSICKRDATIFGLLFFYRSNGRWNDTSANLRNDYNSTITLIILAYLYSAEI